MTIQEAIKQAFVDEIKKIAMEELHQILEGHEIGEAMLSNEVVADRYLAILHSKGVVIQGQSLGFSHPHLANYYSCKPLIEVKDA